MSEGQVFLMFIGMLFAAVVLIVIFYYRTVSGAPVNRTVYRLFGLPVWSIEKPLDEDALYQRMEARFEERMTEALEKVLEEKP